MYDLSLSTTLIKACYFASNYLVRVSFWVLFPDWCHSTAVSPARQDPFTDQIWATWESKLQITFSDEFRKEALRTVNLSSSCARISLIQFKVHKRLHHRKAEFSKLNPNVVGNKCNRFKITPLQSNSCFGHALKYMNFGRPSPMEVFSIHALKDWLVDILSHLKLGKESLQFTIQGSSDRFLRSLETRDSLFRPITL